MAEFMIICLIIGVCYAIGKSTQDGCESSGDQRGRSYYRSRASSRSRSSRNDRQSSGHFHPPIIDRASSPVGGTCLNCGAIIEEETSRHCPHCGALRQRCPICQRFIAGNQALLGCPHCEMLGHKNEIETWIRKKGRCPHCGAPLNVSMLISPEQIQQK
jgi:hypothetical protein